MPTASCRRRSRSTERRHAPNWQYVSTGRRFISVEESLGQYIQLVLLDPNKRPQTSMQSVSISTAAAPNYGDGHE